MPGQSTREVSRDEFLHHGMVYFNGEHFSVRQTIIKACANRLGGVHIEDPAGDSDEKSRYSAIEFRPDRWWGTGHVPHSLLRGGNPFARHWPNCTTG